MTVPGGFVVEQVAGPPLVDRPIVGDFDPAGHFYVAESSGSNAPVEQQLEEKPHRVLRLTDTDGDGVFDSRTVFADRMMFPEGLLWFRGSVYVSAPPQIWKLTDSDGDGVAEGREVWFDAKTLTGCANDLHGPYAGRDGWIYWCKGAFAEQTYERPDKEPFVTRAAHIFRRRPEGGVVEPVMTGGMDNPVDVVFAPTGERFFTTTFFQHPGGGRRDGIVHAVYGGVYGKEHGVLDGHPRTGGLMPVLEHLGPAAPCGLELYESDAFGREFTGDLFATLFNLHQVTRHKLHPSGASFTSETSVFLECDDLDFHPTDVIEDADGSLVVVNTGGWYKLCCPTSQLHKPDVLGAIYRVRRVDAARRDDPRGNEIGWDEAGTVELVDLLGDGRPDVVERAIEGLAARGDASVPVLEEVVAASDSPVDVVQNAVWALTRIDSAGARVAVRAALKHGRPGVVQAALHSVSVWRDTGAAPGVAACIRTGSPAVRRAAAEAMGRVGDASAVPLLLAGAGEPGALGDRALHHSLTYAVIEIGDADAIVPWVGTAPRAALWALDGTGETLSGVKVGAEVVVALGQASWGAEARDAAWRLAERNPGWGPEVVARVRGILAEDPPGGATGGDEIVAECQAGLARMASTTPAVRAFVTECLGDDAMRPFAAGVIGRTNFESPPAGWVGFAIGQLREKEDGAAVDKALSMVRPWLAGGPQEGEVDVAGIRGALDSVARSPELGRPTRVAAIELLAGEKGYRLAPDLFGLVVASLGPSSPPETRGRAVAILTGRQLERDERARLARAIARVGPMELTKLLPAFAGDEDPATGQLLVDALSTSPAAKSLTPRAVDEVCSGYPDSIKAEVEASVLPRLMRPGHDAAELETLLGSLPGDGDVRRGQRVFQSTKAACATCHTIGYVGGELGPDLGRIGAIRSRRDLLEAVVFPSASFVRSYEPVVVTKGDGGVLGGIIKSEGRDGVRLAIGPGVDQWIAHSEIESVVPGPVSLMPTGMHTILTPQELADLLTFLQSRK